MVCGAHQVGYTTHRITFLMARIHLAPLQVELHYPESTGTLELISVISRVIHFISAFKSPASLPSAHILTHMGMSLPQHYYHSHDVLLVSLKPSLQISVQVIKYIPLRK